MAVHLVACWVVKKADRLADPWVDCSDSKWAAMSVESKVVHWVVKTAELSVGCLV